MAIFIMPEEFMGRLPSCLFIPVVSTINLFVVKSDTRDVVYAELAFISIQQMNVVYAESAFISIQQSQWLG